VERPRTKTQYDPSPIFTRTLGTAGTFIAPTWRGLYTQRAEAFRNNKSGTKYCMPETSQRKAALRGSSTTRNVLRSRHSASWSRSAERVASLWTARRKHIAARRRSACRSRSAALDAVRRRFTASAPALRAASLCHVRSLRVRRIGIMRNHRLLGEAVAPEKWCGVKKQIGDMGPGLRQAGRGKEAQQWMRA
jgi:hypothetical protein